jgi:hypothetical protein
MREKAIRLREINAAAHWTAQPCLMPQVTIFCPRTGSNVQVWVAKAKPGESADTYDAVTCPACGLLHFVNKATGKTLGDRIKPRPSVHR